MTTTTFIVSLLAAVAFGVSALSSLVLASRVRSGSIYLPLMLFFLVNALTELSALSGVSIFSQINIRLSHLISFVTIPLLCSLAPLFWIYVRALTSESMRSWSRKDLLHFTLPILSIALPIVAWLMPSQEFADVFRPSGIDNPRNLLQIMFILGVKVIDVLTLLQVGVYIVLIIRRLRSYRVGLTQLFATTEHLELRWFNWLAMFLLAYLGLSLVSLLADTLFESPHSLDLWESLIDVGLITTLAVWSLRQKPGLAIETMAIELESRQLQREDHTKYQNSGLSEQHRSAIAAKLEQAMKVDKFYRLENLSLSVLAKHIKELPSYVTQTLNIEIGESFFDYINSWRIDYASEALIKTDETVLDIAVDAGFNSRSSFYKAFKNIKGCTPSEYRKRHR